MTAVARMEHNGTPIDVETFEALRTHWAGIQERLIADVDSDYGVFDGTTFKSDRFAAYLSKSGIPWPRRDTGALALDDDTFRQMAKAHPKVAALRELRHARSQMRLHELSVGQDGCNRCMLSAFASKTGRNQPSNSRFIFGPAVWLRGLIKPRPGFAVAYVDWSQQEFGIAGALSGDPAMQEAYASGDPYLAFAMQAGAAPGSASKESHGSVRELFKQCVLAVQYGMGSQALAERIGKTEPHAKELLRLHRETYPTFWKWSDDAVTCAMLTGRLHSVFGWQVHVGEHANERSLRNFPMQANGAEMLRLACCSATERGIRVCAPVHDAVLIEAPMPEILDAVAACEDCMREASQLVLRGIELRTDVKIISHPNRYLDGRGEKMWVRILKILSEMRAAETPEVCVVDTGSCA